MILQHLNTWFTDSYHLVCSGRWVRMCWRQSARPTCDARARRRALPSPDADCLYLNPYRVRQARSADVYIAASDKCIYRWRTAQSRETSLSSWATLASSTQNSPTSGNGSTRRWGRWRMKWQSSDRNWWTGRATSSKLPPGRLGYVANKLTCRF